MVLPRKVWAAGGLVVWLWSAAGLAWGEAPGAEGQAGTPAGAKVAASGAGGGEQGHEAQEQALLQEAELLLEVSVCGRCGGLGLVLEKGGAFRRQVLTEGFSARPDRYSVEPLVRKLAAEDVREFPQARLCPRCYGLGFRFGAPLVARLDRLRSEFHLHRDHLSQAARRQLQQQLLAVTLAQGYFEAIRDATEPYLPDREVAVRRRVSAQTFYHYRLALAEVFTRLVSTFPVGEPSLERDRRVHQAASTWKPSPEARRVVEVIGGVRIPGSLLSYAEWAGNHLPRWDLLEAVHRQEAAGEPTGPFDPQLQEDILRQVRALLRQALCSTCRGKGVITVVARRPEIRGGHISKAPAVSYQQVPCPHSGGTGWMVGGRGYQEFSRRLQEARPRMSPAGFQEAWLLARQFQLKEFFYGGVLRLGRPGSRTAFVRYASQAVFLKQPARVLVASFSFRAQGPEAEELAHYRKTQFFKHFELNAISIQLGERPIPGTSLTPRDWASGAPFRKARRKQALRKKEAAAAEKPPPTPPAGNIPVTGP